MDNVIQLPDSLMREGHSPAIGTIGDEWCLGAITGGGWRSYVAIIPLLTWLRDNSPELLAAAGLAKKAEAAAPFDEVSPGVYVAKESSSIWTAPPPAVATVPVWTPPPLPPKPKGGIIGSAPSAPNGDT